MNAGPTPETIGESIEILAPRISVAKLLRWPPDAFALAASILQETGTYLRIVKPKSWPPAVAPRLSRKLEEYLGYTPEWPDAVLAIGTTWRQYAEEAANPKRTKQARLLKQTPFWIELKSWLDELFKNRDTPLSRLNKGDEDAHRLTTILVQICAAADHACAGVGLVASASPGDMLDLAYWTLAIRDPEEPSTLCRNVRSDRIAVLPKQHTPQCGMTLRSLTHHIALCPTTDLIPCWHFVPTPRGWSPHVQEEPLDPRNGLREPPLNILVVPWPEVVQPRQFEPMPWSLGPATDGHYGFFGFKIPLAKRQRARALDRICEAAKQQVGRIDFLVLPELAIPASELHELATGFLRKNIDSFFMAGIGEAGATSEEPWSNSAALVCSIGSITHKIFQSKHHRWQLDARQIEAFGLGAVLNPHVRWWEHVRLDRRRLTFVPLSPSITLTWLVCEDLARQEPASQLIRAIGPNLVIALLMDGPQMASRWPSRYATVLADDPGSSVLTVTSIGMSKLCRPAGTTERRTVAMWKDPACGVREIDLPPGAQAVVLSLANKMTTEWSADGRNDLGSANLLSLSGVTPIFVGANQGSTLLGSATI